MNPATGILDACDAPVAIAARAAHPTCTQRCATPNGARGQHGTAVATDGDPVRVLDASRAKNPFYHAKIAEYLRFIIPKDESVLMIGCADGALLSALQPSRGVGIDDRAELIEAAQRRHPDHEYVLASDFGPPDGSKFEYIVLDNVLGKLDNAFALFKIVAASCNPTSRVILIEPNRLFRLPGRLMRAIGLSRIAKDSGSLGARALLSTLGSAGLEVVATHDKLHCASRMLGAGRIINAIAGLVPFAGALASTRIIVARRAAAGADPATRSASIVMAMRDERDNVEPLIRAIPTLGTWTEIIIVEGHSVDGTRQEVQRVIEAYPDKNIRLVPQSGSGIANAILEGFLAATGDVIILLEADQTSPPEDTAHVFDVIASGRADYVNGSRFMYPKEKGAMPLPNVLGNRFFAAWFTWFHRQRTTDLLCGLKGIEQCQFRRIYRRWGFLGVFDPFSDFELAFGAARLGLVMREVPTRYAVRPYGKTKIKVLTHGWMLARMVLRATRVFKCR